MEVSEMDIGSGRSVFIPIRDDIATYFGITTTNLNNVEVTRTRSAHTRRVYDGLTDTTGRDIQVPQATWVATPKVSKGRGQGQPVKIPLGQQTTQGNERHVIIRIPRMAIIIAIQNWVAREFTLKTPDYIIVQSGAHYPVIAATAADLNPGNEPDPNG